MFHCYELLFEWFRLLAASNHRIPKTSQRRSHSYIIQYKCKTFLSFFAMSFAGYFFPWSWTTLLLPIINIQFFQFIIFRFQCDFTILTRRLLVQFFHFIGAHFGYFAVFVSIIKEMRRWRKRCSKSPNQLPERMFKKSTLIDEISSHRIRPKCCKANGPNTTTIMNGSP